MQALITHRAIVPINLLSRAQLALAEKGLRFAETKREAISQFIKIEDDPNVVYEDDLPEETVIDELRFGPLGRYVSVPVAWALHHWPHIKFKDRTTNGAVTFKFKNPIEARNPEQERFFKELLIEARKPGPQRILANATTGAGKSVSFVNTGLELGSPFLIFVDSNKLKNQYIKLFDTLMGGTWRRKYVGVAQQDECDFEGRAVVIAMVQSVAVRKYPAEFYDYFGLICYDEVQIFAASNFHKTLSMFSARVLLGLTATNKKGEFGRVIKANLGKPRIKSTQEVMKPNVAIIRNHIDSTFRCESDGMILTELAKLPKRNNRLARIIYNQGYARDRVCLVLSNRIFQLKLLRDLLREEGVPDEAMGLHVATYETDRFHVCYQYGEKGKRQRLVTYANYSMARNAYNRLQRNPAREFEDMELPAAFLKSFNKKDEKWKSVIFSTVREEYSPTQLELDNITHSCQIILATYEIFSKGVDVPRIDWGIEALPTGDVTQPLGRVLRILEGKATPEWVSFDDRIVLDPDNPEGSLNVANALNGFFESKSNQRMRGFIKSGATITSKKHAD